jgi:hypothetical protein
MPRAQPPLDRWRHLYDLAVRVRDLAPWQWMEENDVFGVEVPDGERLFVSVLGGIGQHFAVSAYRGAGGLWDFLDLIADEEMPPERLLEIAQLQVSFEDRRMLQREDRDLVKRLGLTFRGPNAWPLFRSFRPACAPWFLEDAELDLVAVVLEQTLDVAPRQRATPALLRENGEERWLVRVRRPDGVWEDRVEHVPEPPAPAIPVIMDVALLDTLKRLDHSRATYELDVFMYPTPVQEQPDERPTFPYLAMLADSTTGTLFAADLLRVQGSIPAMWAAVPQAFGRALQRAGRLPAELHVRSDVLYQVLGRLASELRMRLRLVEDLPAVNAAREALVEDLTGE